jgi:hypothetical protein
MSLGLRRTLLVSVLALLGSGLTIAGGRGRGDGDGGRDDPLDLRRGGRPRRDASAIAPGAGLAAGSPSSRCNDAASTVLRLRAVGARSRRGTTASTSTAPLGWSKGKYVLTGSLGKSRVRRRAAMGYLGSGRGWRCGGRGREAGPISQVPGKPADAASVAVSLCDFGGDSYPRRFKREFARSPRSG